LTCEGEEVLIARDEPISFAALGQVQEWLIVLIAAKSWAFLRRLDCLAIGKIAAQQLHALFWRKPKSGIAEYASQFSSGGARDERD
jgi:hypothetical protein